MNVMTDTGSCHFHGNRAGDDGADAGGHCRRGARTAWAVLAALALGAGLTACIGGRTASLADTHYDLGVSFTQPFTGALPPVKVLDATAPPSLDSDNIVYRIGGQQAAQQVAHYANSHWTMPPARLFSQALRDDLASAFPVLSGGDATHAPTLKTELDVFDQIFDSATVSKGIVSVRATLLYDGRVVSQRTFTVTEPAVSPDAAGGAQALARASGRMTRDIGAWLAGLLVQDRGQPHQP